MLCVCCTVVNVVCVCYTAMDTYNKLSEVGVVLYQSGHYDMCIQLLEMAQRFQTNQKGQHTFLTGTHSY
jgi:hypothetical protein